MLLLSFGLVGAAIDLHSSGTRLFVDMLRDGTGYPDQMNQDKVLLILKRAKEELKSDLDLERAWATVSSPIYLNIERVNSLYTGLPQLPAESITKCLLVEEAGKKREGSTRSYTHNLVQKLAESQGVPLIEYQNRYKEILKYTGNNNESLKCLKRHIPVFYQNTGLPLTDGRYCFTAADLERIRTIYQSGLPIKKEQLTMFLMGLHSVGSSKTALAPLAQFLDRQNLSAQECINSYFRVIKGSKGSKVALQAFLKVSNVK